MELSQDQVEELSRSRVDDRVGVLEVIEVEVPQYEESKYVSFHSLIVRDHMDGEYYRVQYEQTKEDGPEIVTDSVRVRRVIVNVVTRFEYREV